jgi:hypothetical protein
MTQRWPHLLAILTAFATALAAIPLFAAALAPPPGGGACFSTAPSDCESGVESRGAGCSEEREEREQEEDGDGKLRLTTGGVATVRPTACPGGAVVLDRPAPARRFQGPAFSIRGPPAG